MCVNEFDAAPAMRAGASRVLNHLGAPWSATKEDFERRGLTMTSGCTSNNDFEMNSRVPLSSPEPAAIWPGPGL